MAADRTDPGRPAASALPLMRLGWSLMIAASLGCAALGWLASPATPAQASHTPLTRALTGLAALIAVGTLWLDRTILSPKQIAARLPVPDLALAQRHLLAGHAALWSLAVLPSLLGLALALLDGPRSTHLALGAVSLGVLARLMPTRRRIEARLAAAVRPRR